MPSVHLMENGKAHCSNCLFFSWQLYF